MASPKREMTGGRQGARRDCKLVAKMKLPHRESTALREIRGRKGRIGEARRCDNIVLSFPFPPTLRLSLSIAAPLGVE